MADRIPHGVLLALLAVFTACAEGMSGTWADASGVTTYEFHPDGRARITVLGASVPAEYTLDDDKVTISSPQGTVVLTRRDGRLYGPMGLELVRNDPSRGAPAR